jgi:hypothetical protein
MTSIGRAVSGFIPKKTLFVCPGCRTPFTVSAGHFEVFKCECGMFVWALQPKRNGPLKIVRWPGGNLTKSEVSTAIAAPGPQTLVYS